MCVAASDVFLNDGRRSRCIKSWLLGFGTVFFIAKVTRFGSCVDGR